MHCPALPCTALHCPALPCTTPHKVTHRVWPLTWRRHSHQNKMAATRQTKMLQLEEGPVPSLESVYIPEYSQISLKSILSSPTEVEKHIKKYVEAYQTLISNMMRRSIPSLYPGDSEVLKMTVPCGNVELLKQNTGITSEHFAVFPSNRCHNSNVFLV